MPKNAKHPWGVLRNSLILLFIVLFKTTTANNIDPIQNDRSANNGGTLYPQMSTVRDFRTLDGVWNFRISSPDIECGYRNSWYKQDLAKTGPVIPMPVPSSYNDVTQDINLRDHVGSVWYDRRFFVPPTWSSKEQRIWLRFSSVQYTAEVWVNGKLMTKHKIGNLPFSVDITNAVYYNTSNLLTVMVDNTLNSDTIPQGTIDPVTVNNKIVALKQSFAFDFFNYAGIHRSVFLYTTPVTYIDDVVVNTITKDHTGLIIYKVTYNPKFDTHVKCLVELFDKAGNVVGTDKLCSGVMIVKNATFWWPYRMHPNPGYLYTLKTSLVGPSEEIVDTYSHNIGLRSVTWTNTTIRINGKPLYLKGFGMHEDSHLRGKGWDSVLWVKNFNLLKWVGANAFRTSHYPYAEEIYQLADEQGIMIIGECPSVNTDIFSDPLLQNHKRSLTEMIRRDKNHPSVIMWSISNEPESNKHVAGEYFRKVVKHVKSMDTSRPITFSTKHNVTDDKAVPYVDVISFNRYNGWYLGAGEVNDISKNITIEISSWHQKYNKTVLMSEYGADTIAGMHSYPEHMFSEEYQIALMSQHFKAFDKVRRAGFFAGEFIWNFADFNTPQSITRVGGNKKGIFTRERQPKASAHHLRARYLALAAAEAGAPPPQQHYYVADHPYKHEEM